MNELDSVTLLRQKDIISVLSTGTRVDGRKLDQYRKANIRVGVYEKADGSAIVSLGNTVVVAGIKLETGEPFPDTPNEGVLAVNLELLPHASPSFEPGPPDENAIEMARIVDRGIRESKSIKSSELCIVPGKKVWIVYVDISAMDHDGNIVDAAGLAAMAALLSCKIPDVRVEGEEFLRLDTKKPIPLVEKPVPVTVAKIGDYLVVDPTLAEEEVSDVKVTVTTLESGVVSSIQKSGSGTLTEDDVRKIYDLALEKGRELRSLLSAGGE